MSLSKMKYNMPILFMMFSIWISIYVITGVNSLMCYECNSQYHPDCWDLKNGKMGFLYKYCTPPNISHVEKYQRPLCRLINQKIKVRNNMRVIKRSCGFELYQHREDDICYQVRNEDHEETVCQCFEDGCNEANIKSSNFHFLNLGCCFSLVFWYFR